MLSMYFNNSELNLYILSTYNCTHSYKHAIKTSNVRSHPNIMRTEFLPVVTLNSDYTITNINNHKILSSSSRPHKSAATSDRRTRQWGGGGHSIAPICCLYVCMVLKVFPVGRKQATGRGIGYVDEYHHNIYIGAQRAGVADNLTILYIFPEMINYIHYR